MSKKVIVGAMTVLMAAAVTVGIVGCGAKKASGPKKLQLSHVLNVNHPVHEALTFMAEKVKEKSGGKLIIDVFPGGQLGKERKSLEKMQLGTLAIGKVSCARVESFVPQMKVFSQPYLFRDKDHYWKALKSDVGKELLTVGTAKGLRGLCYLDAGARSFYFKDLQIKSPADLAGKKVRVMNQVSMDMISAMGGSATPIPWAELYTALSTGVVDGAENNPPSFYSEKHYDVCKYYSLNEHTMIPDILVISEAIWSTLTPEEQGWLQTAADETSDFYRTLWDTSEKEALAAVKEAGVTVITPDKAPFREKVKSMMDNLDPEIKALVDRIQAVK